MIRDLKAFYVAICENKVVHYDTNLSKFIDGFKLIEPSIKGYQYYNKEFKRNSRIVFISENDRVYFLQKVI